MKQIETDYRVRIGMRAALTLLCSTLFLCALMGTYALTNGSTLTAGAISGGHSDGTGTDSGTSPAGRSKQGQDAQSMAATETRSAGLQSADAPADGKLEESTAMRYARAIQERDCGTVIALTQWMRDRLDYVRVRKGPGEPAEAAREALCRRLESYKIEQAQLSPEGVEDVYVFMPGAILEPVMADAGRDDLQKPVRRRIWIRVTYPVKQRALRDASGRAIRSLLAGANISHDECVLKASIDGNLEIPRSFVRYDWP